MCLRKPNRDKLREDFRFANRRARDKEYRVATYLAHRRQKELVDKILDNRSRTS